MRRSYDLADESPVLGWALRRALASGYKWQHFKSDFFSGLIVAIVAIPLAMALAIASGAPPQNGLYTAIIAGFFCAILGGSPFQVTGPTAAFVVLLVPIVHKFGLQGLLLTGFLSGIVLIILGATRLGSIIRYIPHPVTTGFTSGIAIVIATIQIKDFLGLKISTSPEHFFDRVYSTAAALPSISPGDTLLGAVTLGIFVPITVKFKRTSAPIFAILGATAISLILKWAVPSWEFATIQSRFAGGIPQGFPPINVSWLEIAHFTHFWDQVVAVLPSALSISALAAIESLLSAAVAGGMTRTSFNPNSELLALGISNMLGPFFGGIPATGAIARTTTNVRFGAQSPVAAAVHAITILVAVLALAPLANYLPLASLAALLLVVAWNMAERHHFMNIIRKGDPTDRWVLVTCFSLTVLFDMTVGVSIGLMLAGILFIRRVSNLFYGGPVSSFESQQGDAPRIQCAPQTYFFEIRGAMFFGTAFKAIQAINTVSNDVKIVVLDLSHLQLIDTTGLVALKSSLEALHARQKRIIMIGKNEQIKDQVLDFLADSPVKASLQWYASLEGIKGHVENPA